MLLLILAAKAIDKVTAFYQGDQCAVRQRFGGSEIAARRVEDERLVGESIHVVLVPAREQQAVIVERESGETTVGGGQGNISAQYSATVGGGVLNNASGYSTTIAGGEYNATSYCSNGFTNHL